MYTVTSQNHYVWNDVVTDDALSEYTKIAIDLPGHGQSFRSEYPEKDYSLRAMATYLANFCNQFAQQGYVLVGCSLATNYIGEKAHSFENCKGIFLIGSCMIGENITPNEIVMPNPHFTPTFSATATDAELNNLMYDQAFNVSPQLLEQLKAMYRHTDPQLRVQLAASIANQDYGDEIGNLWKQNIPIAVVYGAEEKLIYPDYMDGLNLKLWQNTIIKIPNAGHCCQFDEPQLIAGMVGAFATGCFK